VERYITALYWTMSTMGTVGYGDVLPGNNDEKIFSMASILLGCTVFAYFMTSMGRIMGSMHMANRALARKIKVRTEV
jgi:voltage-gated potassium channel